MSSRNAVAVAFAAAALIQPQLARACAGCSNPNLPTARAEYTTLQPGSGTAALNLTATTMRVVHSEECPEIGPICSERLEPPQVHDQRFYLAELRPIVAVGLTPLIGVELQTPVRLVSTTIAFRRPDGTEFEPDYENIHHRNETLFGLADPWLLGRVSRAFDELSLTGRAGLGLPLGSTEEDPFARGRAGLAHQHIQFGTGTFHPVLALDAALDLGRLRLSSYGQAILFLYANAHGYRAGNRFVGGASGDVEVLKHLRAGVAGDVVNEQPERWGGVIQQDGNVGRTDVLAGVSVSYRVGSVSATLSGKVPVYQHFIRHSDGHRGDPGQLTYPAILNLAVQTSFGREVP